MKLVNMIVGYLMLLGFALAIPTIQFEAEAADFKREVSKSTTSNLLNNGLPHPVTDMIFAGTVGGHEIEFNGTIQASETNAQVVAHAQSLYPDIDANFQYNSSASDLVKRNKAPPPLCWPVYGQDWQLADLGHIQQGIAYLQGVKGPCGVSARSCVRISCSYLSAIYLCNDNYYAIYPNCGYMASYATDIDNSCGFNWNDIGEGVVCGQLFDTDQYNIIVRNDNC